MAKKLLRNLFLPLQRFLPGLCAVGARGRFLWEKAGRWAAWCRIGSLRLGAAGLGFQTAWKP